jgi:hypothetical protein
MTSIYWTLRGLRAPLDRRERNRLADVIARTIAADPRFRHKAAADEQVASARNMMVHKWAVGGTSVEIARTYGDELAARIAESLARLRGEGPP